MNRNVRLALAQGVEFLPQQMAGEALFTGFTTLLTDGDHQVQQAAAKSLVSFGRVQGAVAFRKAVRNLVLHKDYMVRQSAISSLTKLQYRDDDLREDIMNALSSEDPAQLTVAGEAVRLLARPVDDRVLDRLKHLMSDDNDMVRGRAFSAIEDLGSEAARPDLVERLLEPYEHPPITVPQPQNIIKSFGSMAASRKSLEQIFTLLDNDNWNIRSRAVDFLGVIIDYCDHGSASREFARRLRSADDDRLSDVLRATSLFGCQIASPSPMRLPPQGVRPYP